MMMIGVSSGDALAHTIGTATIHTASYVICREKFSKEGCFVFATILSSSAGLAKEFLIDSKPSDKDIAFNSLGVKIGITIEVGLEK